MMPCKVCGMPIPEGADGCVNCALPKKDRVTSMMSPDLVAATKPKRTEKTT